MDQLKILYITKLKDSLANGVTVAVSQLLNSICNYAEIGWLDFNSVDLCIDKRVKRLNSQNWQEFNADIAVFEDPFNTIQYCNIASVLRKNKIPYIISPHGCFTKIALQKKKLKKHIAINTIFKKFLNNSIATQFLCENEKTNSLKLNDALVIPNGIVMTEKYRTVKEIKKIVFIGRKDVRHKGIDFLPLLRSDFQYHCFRLLSVFRAAKKPPSTTSTAHFLPSVYIITENRDFLRNGATTKTT